MQHDRDHGGGVAESPSGPGDSACWVSAPVTLSGASPGFHVSNLEIERIFFEGRNSFLISLDRDLWHRSVVPQVRELTTRFDAEIDAGRELDCATRVVSRSRRAFVMEQVLVDRTDGTVMASCRSVHVTVGPSGAVDIPDELWAAIERHSGRTD